MKNEKTKRSLFDSSKWSAKRIIFMIMLCFGVLQLFSTVIIYYIGIYTFVQKEILIDKHQVELSAKNIAEKLEKNLPNPYGFLELLYSAPDRRETYYALVVDENDTIIAPTVAAGKPLQLKFNGEDVMEDHYRGNDYDAYRAPIGNTGKYLVYFYNWSYIYDGLWTVLKYVVFGTIIVGVVVLLLVWFVVLPRFEKIMQRKHSLEKELGTAHELQQKAVPQSFPKDDRFEMSALLKPTKEVGGDLYDYLIKDDELFFMVGDVSDKGLPAALITFLTGGQFHSIISRTPHPNVGEVMQALNNSLCNNREFDMFCTMFIGKINLTSLEMEYCNAGHEKMVVMRPRDYETARQRVVELLPADSNLVLGVIPDYEYKTEKIQLESGMTLVQYTDGVTETMKIGRQDVRNVKLKELMFGEKRLIKWAEKLSGTENAEEITHSLLNETETFRAKAPQNDDIAIMVIRVK